MMKQELKTEFSEFKAIADDEKQNDHRTLLMKMTPWLAGAGFAAGHVLTSSNCTIPQQGKCSVCGGCVVALASLVTWAVVKKRDGDEWYIEK